MALAFASASAVADWRFEPTLNASTIYTDNVNQSATKPEDAVILSVTPGFTLRSEGSRRVQATMRYGLTGVARFGGDESDDLYHNLNAVGKAELVEDFLFVDGSARVSQELISLLGSPADAEINNRNRATVGTYSISPYIQKRLGTFANALARYTASGAIFENDVANDSSSNSFSAGLNSGTRFDDLSWSLDYSIRKTDYRKSADTTFERVSATLGYALSRKFRVFGTVGEDTNEYLSATDTSGSFYRAGFGWSPTRRTSFEASGGESYFGPVYGLSASHRTRQTRWDVRYSEDVSDISRLATDFSNLQAVTASCPAGTVLPANPALLDLINAGCDVNLFFGTALANNVFISKLLTAGVAWDVGAKTTVSLRLSDLTREFQTATQGEDRVRIVSGTLTYRLSPQTSATGGLSLTRNSLDSTAAGGAAREDDILSFSLGLNRRFTDQLNGALVFRHTQRDSNAANSDYDENRLTATVGMRF
ncbi:TIGR03016 family PEP-CTERM system-associated outer membrane protein [Thiobacillus sp.]|uniref:TIGR03016 family PEP-CTERM system-associated outer membrane protein n=1 Tax=Thiobacillus sp. TaxID=924 RepID=UPI0025FD3C0A|nr:TIGR03016 family PEP-CTERM system-associated outer membrane protein [Thiobacillus sp.]